jgi:hypothetical protein
MESLVLLRTCIGTMNPTDTASVQPTGKSAIQQIGNLRYVGTVHGKQKRNPANFPARGCDESLQLDA